GRGSAFRVHLPLPACDAPDVAGTEARPAGASTAADTRSLDLLLVEDDATVARVVGDLLRMQGHFVVHATQGLAALAELANRRFDLAFVDLDLPGLDGLSLAALIHSQGHALPLVAL